MREMRICWPSGPILSRTMGLKKHFSYSSGGISLAIDDVPSTVQRGRSRDFRFIDTNGEQPFSFITNKSSLLFYFRPPSVRSGAYAHSMG